MSLTMNPTLTTNRQLTSTDKQSLLGVYRKYSFHKIRWLPYDGKKTTNPFPHCPYLYL